MTDTRPTADRVGRVLHVGDYDDLGGAEVVMSRTVALLRDAGIPASTFTSSDIESGRRTPLRYLHNRTAVAALGRRIEDEQPSIVHFHNVYHELSPAVLTVPHRLGVPAVATAHDWHLICPSPVASRRVGNDFRPVELGDGLPLRRVLATRWDTTISRRAARVLQHLWGYRINDRRAGLDRLLCPGRFQADVFQSHEVADVHHLENPRGSPATTAVGPTVKAKRFVFVGRLAPEKGLAEFLRDAPREVIDDLLVIGRGDDEARCRRVATERDASTTFAGHLPSAQVRAVIPTCEVMVIPSRVPEIAALTGAEAIDAGLRLLVSDLGGLRETAQTSQRALMFDPFDPADIDAASRTMLETLAQQQPRSTTAQPHATATRTASDHVGALTAHYAAVIDDYQRRAAR